MRVKANKREVTRTQTHFGLLCGEKRVLGPLQVSVTSVCWTCLGLGRLDCVAFRVRGFWILVELDFRRVTTWCRNDCPYCDSGFHENWLPCWQPKSELSCLVSGRARCSAARSLWTCLWKSLVTVCHYCVSL